MAIPPELKASALNYTQEQSKDNKGTTTRLSTDHFSRSSIESMEENDTPRSVPTTPEVGKRTKSHGLMQLFRKKKETKEETVTVTQNPLYSTKPKDGTPGNKKVSGIKSESDGLALGVGPFKRRTEGNSAVTASILAEKTAQLSLKQEEVESQTPEASLQLQNLISELKTYIESYAASPQTAFRDDCVFIENFKRFIVKERGKLWVETIAYGKSTQALIESLSKVIKKNKKLQQSYNGVLSEEQVKIGKLLFNRISNVMAESLKSSAPSAIPPEVKELLKNTCQSWSAISPSEPMDLAFLKMICLRLFCPIAIANICKELFELNKLLDSTNVELVTARNQFGEISEEVKQIQEQLDIIKEKADLANSLSIYGQRAIKFMQVYINQHLDAFPKELKPLIS